MPPRDPPRALRQQDLAILRGCIWRSDVDHLRAFLDNLCVLPLTAASKASFRAEQAHSLDQLLQDDGDTLLSFACRRCDTESAAKVLAIGAFGRPQCLSLLAMAWLTPFPAVTELLNRGASHSTPNADGWSPLQLAVRRRRAAGHKIVRLLHLRGASADFPAAPPIRPDPTPREAGECVRDAQGVPVSDAVPEPVR